MEPRATETDDPLSDDAITADFRVYQRVRGHRYSLDDVLTAWVAARRAPEARQLLDLGSGIGSVAIMLAWRLPTARVATIEAQEISFALQARNVARNGLEARFTRAFGDFREPTVRAQVGDGLDLVTGTPPYFPADSTLCSSDSQRAHARVELRGGVEAYLEAAAACVREGGAVVLCADAKKPARVTGALGRLGLAAEEELVVHPREGKPALFSVWTLVRGEASRPFVRTSFVARTEGGARSSAQHEIREFFGLPIGDGVEASPPIRARVARGANP
ncbi:MAG: methyltransferase [Sandaracinaceae bacterium]|nr:methyltransferase [Sandaracinaceae bacterium]